MLDGGLSRLFAIGILMTAFASSVTAQTQPDSYRLETHDTASRWIAESRVIVDWRENRPAMTGLECTASHDRNLQAGRPPMEIIVSHPVESGDFSYRFRFNLAENGIIDRGVETVTIGGRPYHRRSIQSRIIPWFGAHGADDIILAYGIGREMFRPNESYPWLPLEFLIPQLFEVEGITLGIAGNFEIAHGEYERRYEELYIDMEGFKESLQWCQEQVNPSGEHERPLPAELRSRINR